MGDERIISIHREMTKMYEEVFLGTIGESIVYFSNKPPKGEFVFVLAKEDYKL
jgi:16S rRNA (cytidine1402-2'-O)-methyltransferase